MRHPVTSRTVAHSPNVPVRTATTSLLKSLAKVGACTSILSAPSRTNHSMSGPWIAQRHVVPVDLLRGRGDVAAAADGEDLLAVPGHRVPVAAVDAEEPDANAVDGARRQITIRGRRRCGRRCRRGGRRRSRVGVGDGVGVGEAAGVGVARGVGVGDGVGEGVGVGDGVGVGEVLGVGVGVGLTGVPAGLVPSETRMRSGRVGSSSVTVQPQAESGQTRQSRWVSSYGPSLEIDLRGSHPTRPAVNTFFMSLRKIRSVARILLHP